MGISCTKLPKLVHSDKSVPTVGRLKICTVK